MRALLSIFASDILPIFVVAGVGFLLARRLHASVRTLSTVAFNALSPCLVFDQLVRSHLAGGDVGRMALFCVLLVATMGVLGRLAAIPLRLDRHTLSTFLLVVMFSNSGNYALPVALFAFGREGLAQATVYFVVSAITVYTVGVFVAASGRHGVRRAFAGVIRVPALYAVVAAAIVLATATDVPPLVMRPVTLLSDAAIPVMLLVLGMQFERAAVPERPAAVSVAVALSLVAAPVVGVALAIVLGLSGVARQVAIVAAAMPAAVITTVLSLEFDLDANLSTSVVFISTLLSPLTLVVLIAYLRR